jgi:hypothetical protein
MLRKIKIKLKLTRDTVRIPPVNKYITKLWTWKQKFTEITYLHKNLSELSDLFIS